MSSRTSCVTAALLAIPLAIPISAQVTQRVTVSTSGEQGDGQGWPVISADGRYVVFESTAANLDPGDLNGHWDVFVRDLQAGTTQRVSVSSSGAQGGSSSANGTITPGGRFVAFQSSASALVFGDLNGKSDIFVRDRQNGTTERVSVASDGSEGNGSSYWPSISADGRFVAFPSEASDLVPGDTNLSMDVFVHDRLLGTTERVDVDSNEVEGNSGCFYERTPISGEGRFVAFTSWSSNLVPGDFPGTEDVFVRDLQLGTTEQVSVDSAEVPLGIGSYAPSISVDGRFVAFLYAGVITVRDRVNGTTEFLGYGDAPFISADGRHVSFRSQVGYYRDISVVDRETGMSEVVSLNSAGVPADGYCYEASISGDGQRVAFMSRATNLVPDDTNGWFDHFVRDRDATRFISLCNAGVGGVIPCPCSNPPSGQGRGCNNSSSTGGASLSASGISYLTMDSLVFTTTGERPTALSIVSQWTGAHATGIPFGMGVRCTSGTFKRLFTKVASGGAITAPDFGTGDPSVSATSAAKGDTILAGQRRWYVVYYRDPILLGGCRVTSAFNATQTGQVTWSL